MPQQQTIIPINIEEEMKTAYIDYSMSVIVSRALPDVRDGLKPVHRRILYAMQDLGLAHNKPHRKSARVVGEVLGKYHPHGDSSVYEAMVRMAQDWSLRYPLVDGQGNFGHIDGDKAAAMRYTEARLGRLADELLGDIKKDTVDFNFNFDDSLKEPSVLPSSFPNLLVNGASGIAVGMATNMLPHNMSEVIDGVIATVQNPDIDTEGLMEHVKAPDFPTGGIIYGVEGVKEAFETGRGRIVLRAKSEIIVDNRGRETIIISEIPYQVNKSSLIVKISELKRDEKVTGISEVRDESDREGIRIVIEVKRDAMAQVVLSKLYKYSQLQASYGVNNVALVKGRPHLLSLKELIEEFIEFRIEIIVRRTQFDLKKAEDRAHIVEGLIIAVDNIDEVIKIIRGSNTVDEARDGLIERFEFTEKQAKAILELRLQKLTGLEIDKLRAEYDELMENIAYYKEILASIDLQKEIVVEELRVIKEKYGDERRTEISYADGEISIEDLIPNEEMIVSISHLGYIKRTKSAEYKVQGRGGKGSKGSRTREADFLEHVFVADAHNYLLLFTEQGRCFWLRVYEIPEASRNATGRVIQNILQIPKDDKVMAYIIVQDLTDEEFLVNNYIMFSTVRGLIKKTSLEQYSRPRVNGINAITINEGDQLMEAKLTNGNSEILLANRNGRAIRFNESKVRPMGRNAAGVIGIRLDDEDDRVVGMVCVDQDDDDATILVVSEKGNGKRSLLEEYRVTNRGGKGVKTINVNEKTGQLIGLKSVTEEDHLVITNKSGLTIRMDVANIRVMGRATQGVRLISLNKNDAIADITVIRGGDEEDDFEEVVPIDEEE
ncbi:DNA gyrase subunit A [Membranicola marinus]|uniref:DNA gyrase subunit A n=1 Tax=Membranihabitans marinus TaxID=1227546 RepID=A0A953LBW2_9BACT|nr:DNA gyrase subunit A [Membranihabitans marinus]MBY5957104.1 DNA gyrase subunit A [Membranihabitans marinus]